MIKVQLIDVVPLLIGVDGNIANLRTKVGDDYMLNKAIDLIQHTRDYIAEQTIVDAVPVVRCKDCKHGEIDDPDFPDQYYCREGCGWNKSDFWCAYGERRDDNG